MEICIHSVPTWLTGKNAVPVRLNPIGQHDKTIALPALPRWPILPKLSENYLQCRLADQEEEEFE